MGVSWGGVKIFALWCNNKIFSFDKLAALAIEVGIPPNLFERLANQWQVKQHLVKVWEILRHLLHDLVIHEFLDTTSLIFSLFVWLANDGGLDWTASRIKLCDGFGVELRGSFCDQRMDDCAETTNGSLFFVLVHATFWVERQQALLVAFFPLGAS